MTPSPRDWPEDLAHENGSYLCRCVHCHSTFTGHKRRVVCHVCHDRDAAESKRRAEWLHEHGAPADWCALTIDEVHKTWADYSRVLLAYHVERNARRELVEALTTACDQLRARGLLTTARVIKDANAALAKSLAMDKVDPLSTPPADPAKVTP